MNATTLNTLVIDQSLGELPPEASELLETYLAQDPEARAEAERIREAVGVTEETVNRRPELFGEPVEGQGTIPSFPLLPFLLQPRLRVAAAVAVLALVAVGGFLAGQRAPSGAPDSLAEQSERDPALLASSGRASGETPWARYRIEDGRLRAGIAVVAPSNAESNDTP